MANITQRIAANGLKISPGAFRTDSYVDSLTAYAGGGQANATVLTANFNRVSTVANAADSVVLPSHALVSANPPGPSGREGISITVVNSGANALAVFPPSGETINGGSANASVSVPVGAVVTFHCITSGAWFTSLGAAQSFATLQATTANITTANTTTENVSNLNVSASFKETPQFVAAAGATQGGATAITGPLALLVTVTSSARGVKLPTAATGLQVTVMNTTTQGCKVYPNTNGKLDASSTNAAVVLAAGKGAFYVGKNTTQWYTLKSA